MKACFSSGPRNERRHFFATVRCSSWTAICWGRLNDAGFIELSTVAQRTLGQVLGASQPALGWKIAYGTFYTVSIGTVCSWFILHTPHLTAGNQEPGIRTARSIPGHLSRILIFHCRANKCWENLLQPWLAAWLSTWLESFFSGCVRACVACLSSSFPGSRSCIVDSANPARRNYAQPVRFLGCFHVIVNEGRSPNLNPRREWCDCRDGELREPHASLGMRSLGEKKFGNAIWLRAPEPQSSSGSPAPGGYTIESY